jgi:glycosyltransferase involved in cell wall biosynthesis
MTSVAISVDQLWFPAPGGIGTYVRHLVPALAGCDPDLRITLFHARFETGPEPPEPWIRRFPVVELSRSVRSLYPSWALVGRPALPASLGDSDLVHATNHAAVPPKGPGQRLVVTVHDLAFLRLPRLFPRGWAVQYRLALRAAVRRADAILVPSRATAEDLVSRTAVDPARVRVTPLAATLPGSDVEVDRVLHRLRVPTPYVLFVGTLEPRKNLVRLVRAYRRIAATDLPHALVLAGPMGWHPEPLLRELALEGPGEIVLTGPLPEADLDALYRGASAFAYPSLAEGFGLPVLEAMARSVPTVVSNTSSLPEVAGDAALLVDPRSVAELAAALQRVLSDTALAERLAAAGRARAERFSWEETARRTLAAYREALGR